MVDLCGAHWMQIDPAWFVGIPLISIMAIAIGLVFLVIEEDESDTK